MTPVVIAPSVGPVIDYLFANISAAVGYDPAIGSDDMLVCLGDPASNEPNNIVSIGEVRRNTNPATVIGSGLSLWLSEVYDISVNINCWVSTGDADSTSTLARTLNGSAWQLVGYVEAVVRDDPSLGELVQLSYPHTAVSTSPEWVESAAGGMRVGITMQIHVEVLN